MNPPSLSPAGLTETPACPGSGAARPWRRLAGRALPGAFAALLPLVAAALEPAPMPTCAAPIAPARMSYRLIDGDRDRGSAEASLTPVGDGRWRYEVVTKGRVGIVTVTGEERSEFEWYGETLRPLAYARKTSAGPFRRRSTATFDWSTGMARGEHRGDEWERPLRDGMIDRLSLQLASARLIGAGAESIELTYLDRGQERVLADEALAREQITLRDGSEWETIRVDRIRGSRATRTWHAPALGLLPVRVEHHDPDDDERYFLELENFEWLACPPEP